MRTKKRLSRVYAGSFDPLTIGHLWMIEQGVGMFDRLIVGIGINPEKKYTFLLEERLSMLRDSLKGYRSVSVTSFFESISHQVMRAPSKQHTFCGASVPKAITSTNEP